MTNATKFFQGFEEFVLKFSTLIMMDFGWKPKVKDVVVVQLFSHSLCRFVSGRVGEVINNHKDIPVPSTGLLKVDKIDRNQLEGGGSDNRLLLSWWALLNTATDILYVVLHITLHPRPVEPISSVGRANIQDEPCCREVHIELFDGMV